MPAATLEKKKPEIMQKAEQVSTYRAPIAIYENGNSYTVLVEMPGADENAVSISVDGGILTITAPLKRGLSENLTLRYSEMCIGNYWRCLDLGDVIDSDKIDATFNNGLLKLTMPKRKNAKSITIPIKTV